MNAQHRRWPRLKPSIDRFGGLHLFEQRPPERYAADLDDTERAALQARDRGTDVVLRRIGLWILLPATVVWLVLPYTRYALPMDAFVVCLIALSVSIVAFKPFERCPNCRRRPDRCVDFCPVCGERSLAPGEHRAPVCTACKTELAHGRRGARRFVLRHCSTCGLRLGRREAQREKIGS